MLEAGCRINVGGDSDRPCVVMKDVPVPIMDPSLPGSHAVSKIHPGVRFACQCKFIVIRAG